MKINHILGHFTTWSDITWQNNNDYTICKWFFLFFFFSFQWGLCPLYWEIFSKWKLAIFWAISLELYGSIWHTNYVQWVLGQNQNILYHLEYLYYKGFVCFSCFGLHFLESLFGTSNGTHKPVGFHITWIPARFACNSSPL